MRPWSLAPSGELFAAVCALAGDEMTVKEFRQTMEPLRSEVLQIVATVLGLRAVYSEPSERVRRARTMCIDAASERRLLS